MKTDTAALKAAYTKRTKALQTAGKAAEQELVAQEKELQRDASAALQNAYVENVRASMREGQANRAAGITGGQAIAGAIGRENQYGATRTDIKLGRETSLSQLANQKKLQKANTAADVAANELSMQGQLIDIDQTDEGYVRQSYASMLQGGYIPSDQTELNKMASMLGLPVESIRAYVNHINGK